MTEPTVRFAIEHTVRLPVDATIRFAQVTDPIELLCRQHLELCRSAVDPLEIAAALEAEGLGDQAVQAKYGVPDVFALAEQLYTRVGRRPAEPAAEPELWRAKPAEHLLHGVLYALPGLCFAAAAPLMPGATSQLGLVVAMLCSWSLSQALSYLGYLRLGVADRAGAARVLRAGLVVGLAVVAAAVGLASLVAPLPPAASLFAIGQAGYLLGATVLMVTGSERLLLVALAPGALVSLGFLVLGQPRELHLLVAVTLAATALLSLAGAVWCTREAGRGGSWITAAELRAAAPHAAFGLLAAGLLLFPVAATTFTSARGGGPGTVLAVVPLSLSMGPAEWILVAYRRRMSGLLRSTGSLDEFTLRSRNVLGLTLLRYLGVAGALIAVAVSGAALAGMVRPHWPVVLEALSYLALGGALFTALVLQALGARSEVTLLATAAALITEVAVALGGPHGHLHLVGLQLATGCALLGVLAASAVVTLSRPVRHQ